MASMDRDEFWAIVERARDGAEEVASAAFDEDEEYFAAPKAARAELPAETFHEVRTRFPRLAEIYL